MSTEKLQYTPGPWSLGEERTNEHNAHCIGIDAQQARILNLAEVFGDTRESVEVVANARLIIAAPDMYEALQDVAAYFDALFSSEGVRNIALENKVTAALTKATNL